MSPEERALQRRRDDRMAPQVRELRDAFVAELAQALGARWPLALAAQDAGLFAAAAREFIALVTAKLGERQGAKARQELVPAWSFLAQLERLRVAIEDGADDSAVASIARTVVGRGLASSGPSRLHPTRVMSTHGSRRSSGPVESSATRCTPCSAMSATARRAPSLVFSRWRRKAARSHTTTSLGLGYKRSSGLPAIIRRRRWRSVTQPDSRRGRST